MLVVDAQIHLWHQNLPTNAAHRQITSWSAEDCLKEMAAAGVDAALIHPPGWDPNSGAIAEAAAQKYPDRFAILGNFPPDKPESRSLIAGWKSRPGMLGLRWAFTQPHQQSWMTDGTMDWVWPACEKAGIPVALMASNHTGDLVNGQFGRPARGMGFGLGVQVVEDPVAADLRQSKGTFGWAGAYGTNINIDPQEKMVNIILMQTSTPQLQRDFENAVMQAIID